MISTLRGQQDGGHIIRRKTIKLDNTSSSISTISTTSSGTSTMTRLHGLRDDHQLHVPQRSSGRLHVQRGTLVATDHGFSVLLGEAHGQQPARSEQHRVEHRREGWD
jgi:hypothetical protein